MTVPEISTSDIENQRFNTSFRGYDTNEVKVFLARLAQQMNQAATREKGLEALVETLQATTDRRSELDAVTVGDGSGSRSADSNHGVAATPSGAESAARLDAEAILSEARTEASGIVAKAHDEAARVVLRARVERRSAATEGDSGAAAPDSSSVREEAKAIVNEAKAVRERILSDLAKRRRVANVQLEQLRAAREKLLESMRESRRIVDAATRDLSTAEVEARVAADVAGRRMGNEPVPTAAQIERELVATRHIGVPLLSDDDPLVEEALPEPAAPEVKVAADAAEFESSPPDPAVPPARVDDLFARLRAEREAAAAAAQAREILALPPIAAPDTESRPSASAASDFVEGGVPPAGEHDEVAAIAAPPPAIAAPPPAGSDQPGLEGVAERDVAERAVAAAVGPGHELRTERLSRALKRALQDEQSSVLAAIRTARGRPELADVLPPEGEHRAVYVAVVHAAFSDCDDIERLQRHGEALVDELVPDVRAAVAAALLLGDATEGDMSQTVSGSYREWRTERIVVSAGRLVDGVLGKSST